MAWNYLHYVNRIPLGKVQEEIPVLNPLGMEYRDYWLNQWRLCIDGRWVEHAGEWKWVPPSLHFYGNFWSIKKQDQDGDGKVKDTMRPTVRDLEWIKHYMLMEARGFSGFSDDHEVSCHRILAEFDELGRFVRAREPQEVAVALQETGHRKRSRIKGIIYRPDGTLKRYMRAMEYLYQYFTKPLGKAQYVNDSSDIADIEARGGGKSFTCAGMAGWHYLMDGATDFDTYIAARKAKKASLSETLLSAYIGEKVGKLVEFVQLGLNNIPGSFTIGEETYPAPLSRQSTEDWSIGGEVYQSYRVKIGGRWLTKGSQSVLILRSFKNNTKAANGWRWGLGFDDEVGFQPNLLAAKGAVNDVTMDGSDKFGVFWMTGTGGEMEGGATRQIQTIFYDPAAWNCLAFDDPTGENANPIGFFVPKEYTLNDFKDELGNTDVAGAGAWCDKEDAKKKLAKDPRVWSDHIQNNPRVPSHAFLATKGNKFPVAEAKAWRDWLRGSHDGDKLGTFGEMVEVAGSIAFTPITGRRAVPYPTPKSGDLRGGVTLYEEPTPGLQYAFVGGTDTIDRGTEDNKDGGGEHSLMACYIVRRAVPGVFAHDQVVASYVGRPERAKQAHEQVRLLTIYYDAQNLHENALPGLKMHFDHKQSLQWLAHTPGVLKSNANSNVSRTYGQHVTDKIATELNEQLAEWLTTVIEVFPEAQHPYGDKKLLLHTITDEGFLEEIINFHEDGNFDRIDALRLAVCQINQYHHVKAQERKAPVSSSYITRKKYV